jgi:hypothetical protein
MAWLDAIPRVIVRACAAMLPRLRAEDALLAVNQIGVGTGSFGQGARQSLIHQWTAMARAGDRVLVASSAAQMTAAAAGMGIGFAKVTK